MTCKDCIHCEVCPNKRKHHIIKNGFLFYFECESIENICKSFKDKSKYIELPCKIGDKVYVIHNIITTTPFIKKETVLYIEYCLGDAVKTWRITTEYGSYDYKHLFFTKEEAEQKLKELNNK